MELKARGVRGRYGGLPRSSCYQIEGSEANSKGQQSRVDGGESCRTGVVAGDCDPRWGWMSARAREDRRVTRRSGRTTPGRRSVVERVTDSDRRIRAGTGDGTRYEVERYTLAPTRARRSKAPQVPGRARQKHLRRAPAASCVGCETQGRPGRSARPNLLNQRRGNRRRRSRRRGAATANYWRTVRPEPQAVVRSTLPKAKAVVSALARAP